MTPAESIERMARRAALFGDFVGLGDAVIGALGDEDWQVVRLEGVVLEGELLHRVVERAL